MTIQQQFYNWAHSNLDWRYSPYDRCSPNLLQLTRHVISNWGGYSLGCHQDRTVRQGSSISSHAYGAATDWRYTPVPTGKVNVSRQVIEQALLPWLISHSKELHIDAIHDYFGDRIWRAGRTANINDAYGSWWKKQYGAGSGMGESWATYLHWETHLDGFQDNTPIADRFGASPPPSSKPPDTTLWPTPPGTPMIIRGATDATTVMPGWPTGRVTYLQTIIGAPWPTTGVWDAASQAKLMELQRIGGITADGVYGPQTAALFWLWRKR